MVDEIKGTADWIHPRNQQHHVHAGVPHAHPLDQACPKAGLEEADVDRVDLLPIARARQRTGEASHLCSLVPPDGTSMKGKSTALTGEERDVLILSGRCEGDRYLGNNEIGQRLGMSVNRVKTLIHQACIKLEADNRVKGVLFAMRRGDISVFDLMSLDELAIIFSSLDPAMLRRMAQIVRQAAEPGHLPEQDEQIIHTDARPDTILTKRERDVLILVGRGSTNTEIADTLCMSVGTVRTFLYRACVKLGAHRRADAVRSALMRREIGVGEIHSQDQLLYSLASSGADPIEQLAHMVSQTASG